VDERRLDYLQAMGIEVWRLRGAPAPDALREQAAGSRASPLPPESAVAAVGANSFASSSPVRVSDMTWDELATAVRGCTLCELHQGRTQSVFGVGNRAAGWLIVGEAPGAEEDKRGEPFVGRAGQLLNAMLDAIGLKREQVYIANILKCRPPNNRDPRPGEVACCEPYLKRQIALLRPKIILAVGRIAAQNLLKIDTPIGRMRGQRYAYGDAEIPVIVTYHPAYLLRSPQEKRKAWQDLMLAKRCYSERP
jgi:DNA polymerase